MNEIFQALFYISSINFLPFLISTENLLTKVIVEDIETEVCKYEFP